MNNYGTLYGQVKTAINSFKEVGQVFYIRDCINNPPIMLGLWLRKDIDAKKIPGVVFYGKDAYGTNQYKKVD
ncbi:hypothetical protein NST28_15870 [Paenibacillus sp. FSL R10-2791]|uniref:hypothetical protein n=1 Tax=Paenibacillus sp. FSL R10-2791 TaxID=2954695 RepID=UPI0030FA4453